MSNLKYKHDLKVKKILRERLSLLNAAANDVKLQSILKERCKRDVKFFCNYFVTTYNPRLKPLPAIVPFVLFPRQEECLTWLETCYIEKNWGAVVKCRYTGLSWICSVFLVHKLLFEKDFTGIMASNLIESVDKLGDTKTLFSKLEMIIQWLPVWFHSIDLNKHRKLKLLRNPEMNSLIGGEGGKNIGRGGRSSIAIIDEFAHVERDVDAISALSENTDCAIFVSTPKGTSNKFYAVSNNAEIKTFYYRWQADPRRTPEWRERQTIKLGKSIAAQELDCDFNASVEGTFIEMDWILACVDSHLKIKELEQASATLQAGLDVAVKGSNETVLTIRKGSIVTDVIPLKGDYVSNTAQNVIDLLNQDGEYPVDLLCFDADGVGIEVAGTLEKHHYDFDIIEFHGNQPAIEREWEGIENITSRKMFYNARADAWGIVKHRIKNTFEHINGIAKHEPSDMISIPNHQNLIQDLNKPTAKYRGGKLLLESKQDMRARGISSPDYADSLVYAFYTNDQDSGSWILDL